MSNKIPVLVMLPPSGRSKAERWMGRARQAAALDLLELLLGAPETGKVHVLAADPADGQVLKSMRDVILEPPAEPFHFGRVLAEFTARTGYPQLAYYGGTSAPLMNSDLLGGIVEEAVHKVAHFAVVNNLHSTDWMVLSDTAVLSQVAERLPSDNPLGWVLEREAGYTVRSLAPNAATRADIDTPADVLLLEGHPRLGTNLKQFTAQIPPALTEGVRGVRRVIGTPASTLAVIGRCSSRVWSALERETQIWVRLFVEERGMVASGRLHRNEVRSFMGQIVEDLGPGEFVQRLAGICDAALWDTRVWMAHRGAWPSDADRFASDLGWPQEVEDPDLRALTEALAASTIPIVAGGHGTVAGGVYALLESLGKV